MGRSTFLLVSARFYWFFFVNFVDTSFFWLLRRLSRPGAGTVTGEPPGLVHCFSSFPKGKCGDDQGTDSIQRSDPGQGIPETGNQRRQRNGKTGNHDSAKKAPDIVRGFLSFFRDVPVPLSFSPARKSHLH
jgi:hypothetical protein